MHLAVGEVGLGLADLNTNKACHLCDVAACKIDLDGIFISVLDVDAIMLSALRAGRHIGQTEVRTCLRVNRRRRMDVAVRSEAIRFEELLPEVYAGVPIWVTSVLWELRDVHMWLRFRLSRRCRHNGRRCRHG